MTNDGGAEHPPRSEDPGTQRPGARSLNALATPGGTADLQRRLVQLALLRPPLSGTLDKQTSTAIREFQARRGLRVDGICGAQTWAALVGAGYLPGDRLLYFRTPMMQGDDVAELQRQLGTLGFDAGRIDGMFGQTTAEAVTEFQRNVAIAPDGICGPATLAELARLRSARSEEALVGIVREREILRRSPRTLVGRRIAVGHQGGLGAPVETLRHLLSTVGADAIALLHPDGAALAANANLVAADLYLGIHLDPALDASRVAYYRGYRYESAGGRHLAELARDQLDPIFGQAHPVSIIGMTIPELRYSKMPAVVCELTPAPLLVEHATELAVALVAAMTDWAAATWE